MAKLIMLCSLIGTVSLIFVCGVLSPYPQMATSIPNDHNAPAFVGRENVSMSSDDVIRNRMKNGIVEKSIEVMRGNDMSEETIKEKIMQSFSMDEATIDNLMK
jgi:hypothetical protein